MRIAEPVFRGIDPPDQFLILQTLAEVRDRLVIRDKTAGQPHDLHVAAGFTLEPAARLHTIEIAIDVKLQQNRRVIGRPAGGLRIDAAKPQSAQIKRLDKRLNHPNPIVLSNKIIKRFREDRALAPIQTLYKPFHQHLPSNDRRIIPSNAFSHMA